MVTFFGIIGGLCILALCVAFALVALAWLGEVVERCAARRDRRVGREACRELGRRIAIESYWFSESDAHLAVKTLGEAIAEEGQYRIDDVRDDWRRRCQAEVHTR